MKLIKLTCQDGSAKFVNMDLVRMFYVSETEKITKLVFSDHRAYRVKETPKEIFQLLGLII